MRADSESCVDLVWFSDMHRNPLEWIFVVQTSKVGTARTLCPLGIQYPESRFTAPAAVGSGTAKLTREICGFKVFRVGSPPTHCFWESYCPFTVHFYSARYRLARLQETGRNDSMMTLIAFVYAAEILSC
jgi:hypothetical protein